MNPVLVNSVVSKNVLKNSQPLPKKRSAARKTPDPVGGRTMLVFIFAAVAVLFILQLAMQQDTRV